ncbi:MAG: hypothetical protein L3J66_07670 [Bacteroidales bacterium]|nr:hypothetical protein [Bacteroidales bacterium]
MMKKCKRKPLLIAFLHFSTVLLLLYGCNSNATHESDFMSPNIARGGYTQQGDMAIAAPPFNEEGIFPCSDCHAEEVTNPQRRKLVDMHEDISEMFDHDSENRWCLDCHNADDRDYLRLASGKLLSFKESQKLCGQCHGDKYRDWKVGVHGKRTGDWNGKKQYLLCVHCHNPHSPHFKPIKPMPPPVRQKDIY